MITGGKTGEREVSIRSAENVAKIIDFADVETFTFPEEKENFINKYLNFDAVIPMIHGVGGEDGVLQGFLETLEIPYIFSKTLAHAISINKKLTKKIVTQSKIKVANEISQISPSFPLFAKPNSGGSSVASKLCNTAEDLNMLISKNPETDFILEEPLKGREFTVGVINQNGAAISLTVVEIIPKGDYFDFESKYDIDKLATEICPAKIERSLSEELQRQALLVHQNIGIRHISRSDFIVSDDGQIYFLEVNTIPGMTNTSLLPKMLLESSLKLKDLIQEWVSDVTGA